MGAEESGAAGSAPGLRHHTPATLIGFLKFPSPHETATHCFLLAEIFFVCLIPSLASSLLCILAWLLGDVHTLGRPPFWRIERIC